MALGSGLDILFEDNAFESKDIKTLRMSEIEPNKSQPRTVFDEENIKGLADSIKEHGLIQPIVVRPLPNGLTYQISAGERRWRACKLLKMEEVPVIIRETDELEAAELAIVERQLPFSIRYRRVIWGTREIRRAVFSPIPGTASSSGTEASNTLSSAPKWSSSAWASSFVSFLGIA